MSFAILKAGRATRATRERIGDLDKTFTNLLETPGQQWVCYDVENGVLPARVEDHAGYVITGSPASVYDDKDWVRALLEFTAGIHRQGLPLLGICFGLQVVAQALGGEVAPNPKGWELGVVEVGLTPAGRAFPALAGAPAPLRILESHQDIAIRLPEGAEVLAGSTHTPVEIFTLGDRTLCLQGHPEMDNAMVQDIIERRMERGILPEAAARAGLASLAQMPHREFLADWLRGFFIHGGNRAAV